MTITEIALTVGGVCLVSLVSLKIFMKWRFGKCSSTADLSGKTALVTGANTGIGYFTALDFARRNARVLLLCRNQQKGQAAVDGIKESTGNQNVVLYVADLSLMKSVREVAARLHSNEARLDILVNNAGLAGIPFTKTDEGLETIYATNHYGPFLLTNLLLDLLKKTAPSRIVNVSSFGHKFYTMDLGKMKAENAEKDYNHMKAFQLYCNTKLCNILIARELAQRLKGTGVTTYSLDPGGISSDIWRHRRGAVFEVIFSFLKTFLFKTCEEGAQTSIYCSVSEDLVEETGLYYTDCKETDKKSSKASRDMGLVKKVWEISENMTGLVS